MHEGHERYAQQNTDVHGDEHEILLALRGAVGDREGVHVPVQEGKQHGSDDHQVERDYHHDGFEGEEPGARECDAHALEEGHLHDLRRRLISIVAGLGAELLGTPGKVDVGVGLWEEEDGDSGDEAGKNEDYPFRPVPG